MFRLCLLLLLLGERKGRRNWNAAGSRIIVGRPLLLVLLGRLVVMATILIMVDRMLLLLLSMIGRNVVLVVGVVVLLLLKASTALRCSRSRGATLRHAFVDPHQIRNDALVIDGGCHCCSSGETAGGC